MGWYISYDRPPTPTKKIRTCASSRRIDRGSDCGTFLVICYSDSSYSASCLGDAIDDRKPRMAPNIARGHAMINRTNDHDTRPILLRLPPVKTLPWKIAKAIMRKSADNRVKTAPPEEMFREETQIDTTWREDPRMRRMVPMIAKARVAW